MLKVVGSLFAVLAWFALVGLQRIWRYTFGWLFHTLAGLLDDISIPTGLWGEIKLFGSVSSWLRSLDRNVSTQLARRADQAEHLAVWLFSRAHLVFAWIGREIEGLSGDLLGFGLRLLRVYLPRLIRWQLALVWRPLHALIRYAHHVIPQLTRKLFRFAKWATHEITSGAKHLGFLWKWVRAVVRAHLRFFRAIWRRLARLERYVVPKRFRGLVRNALRLLGLEWLFGTNIYTLATWAIAFDIGAVREWVKDAITIATTTDLCKLAGYQFDIAVYVFDPVLQALIGLTEWFCFHSDDELPSATKGTEGYAKAWAPSATPEISGPYLPERLAPNIPLPRGVISA